MPMVVRKVSQIVGLLLLMSTLFLILSVSLYTSEAPNANHYVSDGSTMDQNAWWCSEESPRRLGRLGAAGVWWRGCLADWDCCHRCVLSLTGAL